MQWGLGKWWKASGIASLLVEGLAWIGIVSDISLPNFVVVTILVFHVLQSLVTTLPNHQENRCTSIISQSQSWSAVSYAFVTSTHAILKFLLTVLCDHFVDQQIIHCATAPLLSSPLLSLHQTMLLKMLIHWNQQACSKPLVYCVEACYRLWLSLENSPGLGISDVLPPQTKWENQSGP